MKKFYYLYKITNIINDKIYIGIHCTNNLEDGYMGSGHDLLKDIKKYGKNNFKKEILEFFDSIDDLKLAEKELVNRTFVSSNKTYNKCLGGGELVTYNHVLNKTKDGKIELLCKDSDEYKSGDWEYPFKNTTLMQNKNGERKRICKDSDEYKSGDWERLTIFKNLKTNTHELSTTNDQRIKTGELVGVNTGRVFVTDGDKKFWTTCNDPRYVSGEYVSLIKGRVLVKDKNGNNLMVSNDDPRYISGDLVGVTKGMGSFKDKDGNIFMVGVDDPRVLSGDLVGVTKGFKQSEETKKKISNAQKGNPSTKGYKWVHNELERKVVKEDQLLNFLENGWVLGKGKTKK